MIYYIYNGDELLGFKYDNNVYYYHKNISGDIIGILDSNYNEIVSYEYDSFGNIVRMDDNSNINLGTINPFRYRSYYYDEEIGLYYLNSRYYNPKVGRFINVDGYVATGQGFEGHNMFQYCGNNPITRKDDGGCFWLELAIIGGTVAVGYVIGEVSMKSYVYINESVGVDNPYSGASGAFMSGATTGILVVTQGESNFFTTIIPSVVGEATNVIFEGESILDAVTNVKVAVAGSVVLDKVIKNSNLNITSQQQDLMGIIFGNSISSIKNKITDIFTFNSMDNSGRGSSGAGHSSGSGRYDKKTGLIHKIGELWNYFSNKKYSIHGSSGAGHSSGRGRHG